MLGSDINIKIEQNNDINNNNNSENNYNDGNFVALFNSENQNQFNPEAQEQKINDENNNN